jgi:4-amino-4-deoxy-L-arabinose transferase-like glycosyltransferase
LVALIPRIILANQLDLITDEIIYILTGKSYIPLVRHITTSPWTCIDCWQTNYEHPPLVKFFIGLSILGNNHSGHLLNELVAARMPSIIAGTVLIMVIYWLGRKPFGHIVASLAALSLAFSPWLIYFSSIAYLDMTMTTFITIAYLLTWHATRRPWLYLCVALLVGLGIDSKYTAAFIIPGILLFTAYYFFILRLRLPAPERPALPWLWWLIAGILTPLCFFVLDPVIWSDPLHMLVHSVLYEWKHSVGGHLTYLAGSYSLHVPHWAALYIIINKISAFTTVPAAIFGIIALIYLIRFHLPVGKGANPPGANLSVRGCGVARGDREGRDGVNPWVGASPTPTSHLLVVQGEMCRRGGLSPRDPCGRSRHRTPCTLKSAPFRREEGHTTPPYDPTTIAFLLIWLLATVAMFSLLNIVVGTHYLLPLAPPIAIAGAYTLVYLARYSIRKREGQAQGTVPTESSIPAPARNFASMELAPFRVRFTLFIIIGVLLVGPHLLGLLNTAGSEGYTSEFFHGEDTTLQVAYPGYREAIQWLDTHTQGNQRIGLVALPQTLQRGDTNTSWFVYNSDLPKRLQIQEAHPQDPADSYDYLVWPMHLVQRGYLLPPAWHIIHKITGGDTTYCYIAVTP